MTRAPVIAVALIALSVAATAEPFPPNWQDQWETVLGDSKVQRQADGSLEFDYGPGEYVYFAGGEQVHDYAIAARLKFLRAEDKYSGFSIYTRYGGELWAKRSGFWVYLRPKYRALHMQRVADGGLDDEFQQRIEAVRPNATPVGEWMTLRCEVRGNAIRVYLNDELNLSAEDGSKFPILSGRVAFGVQNAHVILADLKQENLEQSAPIRGISYKYINPPNRGDADRTVLTDGQVNPREEQAFWRMLGSRPEIEFDLGAEYFLTSARLRAISSPAVNIASAQIQGSSDGEEWSTLAVLENEDTRRADAEHEITGDVRRIARYVRLVLTRPAADQDIELAEVEFYGREPTDTDRQASSVAQYVIGPDMPDTTDAEREDDNYWYLQGDGARFAIDKTRGLVAGGWNLSHEAKCIERLPDSYYLYTRDGDTEVDEYSDQVRTCVEFAGGKLVVECANTELPELGITKTYTMSPDGKRLVKRVGFTSTSDRPDRFLTHRTGGVLVEQFRRGGVYMGGDRGLGSRVFAEEVTVPMTNRALGARNSKSVLFLRYDLGWGIAQYRYKVNDHYCRPLTSRWHEKENHAPVYKPNGWEVGLCTLHLAPGQEQSTETHLAMFDGRQYDFYGMYRNLPEVSAQFDAVEHPAWVQDIKTSCDVALNPMNADPAGPQLPIKRTLQMVQTGNVWDLNQIHGVWGDWFTEGVMTDGYGAKLDTQWLKDHIQQTRAISPRVKSGVYTWAWAVHPRSKVYREHPEWFMTTDRNGQVFNAYSNMVLNHARRIGVKESMDELMDQFARIMQDFDGDYFYLDGGGGGQNLIDWEHLGCDQDYDFEELYRRIREVTRACGKDKAVWFNARTGPYWDIGYYEGIDQRLHAATWRESADGLSVVKIRQAYDPEQMVVPLYWRTETMPFYSNYCIGLGITPASPLGADNQRAKLPFIEAAFETRKLKWTEADLEPDWRTDPKTEIEAYALKSGSGAVISLIDHREDGPGSAVVTADVRKLGLDSTKPIYAWVFGMRDIRESWFALPESQRREIHRKTGWGLDLAGRLLDVQVIEKPGDRVELTIPTEPQILRMAILSNSPVGVYAADGLRTHLWLPETLGASAKLQPGGDGTQMHLDVTAPKGGAEFVVGLPLGPEKSPGVSAVRRFISHGRFFTVVRVPEGDHSFSVIASAAAPVRGKLDVQLPETVDAGADLPVTVQPAAAQAYITVERDDVLLWAGQTPVAEGIAHVRLPEQLSACKLTVQAVAVADGKLASGSGSCSVKGAYEPELVPIYMPRREPTLSLTPVDSEVNGLRVLQSGIDTHDGYDGDQYTLADPDHLMIGGGNVDAPKTRYGYGFGGLELEGPHVLTLKITNTFHDAWTFYRDRISYHPTYTTTFAGMMVDYHTPDGYTKRVALGLGLINPKRAAPRPLWGAKSSPVDFIVLGDTINEGAETEMTIDLARWAPPDWDGRFWLSAGADNVLPSRRINVQIIEAGETAGARTVTEGRSVGDLYKMRTSRATRITETVTIDGKLDEPLWSPDRAMSGFKVFGRLAEATQQTRAWVTYDDANLYVAFDCPETEKTQLNTAAKKIWNQDAIDFALDVDADRGDFQQFIVNCNGDIEQFSQNTGGKETEWQITAAADKHEGGYSVEVAIPWSEIGARPQAGTKWVANFVRYRPNPPGFEIQTWSPLPGPSLIVPEKFGEIVFE